MSLYDYEASREISYEIPFYALIMAAIRNADTDNTEKLKREWPEVYNEFFQRYNAPGGILATDTSMPDGDPEGREWND